MSNKKLKIDNDGTVRLPYEMFDSSAFNKNIRVSNIIDFESGSLVDRKFSLREENFKITGRDTIRTNMECYGGCPYTKNVSVWNGSTKQNILDISEYVDKTAKEFKFKLITSYKFKVIKAPKKAETEDIGFGIGIYAQTPDSLKDAGTNYQWYMAHVFGKFFKNNDPSELVLEPGKIYEGMTDSELGIPTNQTQWLPWFQLSGWDTTKEIEIEMYDFAMEIVPISGFISNKLLYMADKIEFYVKPTSEGNYDLDKLEIIDHTGNPMAYTAPKSIKSKNMGDVELKELLMKKDSTLTNKYSTNSADTITIEFYSRVSIIDIRLKHLENRFYDETIVGIQTAIGTKFLLYKSNDFINPIARANDFFNYRSGGYISINLPHNYTNEGLRLTNYQNVNVSKLNYYNSPPELIPDYANLNSEYVTHVTPKGNKYYSFDVISGGRGNIFSTWMQVSKDYNGGITPSISFNASTSGGYQDVRMQAKYDMTRKGEWQLLQLNMTDGSLNGVILMPIINFSGANWDKGFINIKGYQCYYNSIDSTTVNTLKYMVNGYIEFPGALFDNKAFYLEVDIPTCISGQQILWANASTPLTIVMGVDNKINFVYGSSRIIIPVQTIGLTKILINRDGGVYVNGEKYGYISGFTNVSLCQLGAPYNSQFLGTFHKLVTYYDNIEDVDARNMTKIENIMIPLFTENYQERDKRLQTNYLFYHFPLIDDYYDTTRTLELPCYNIDADKRAIIPGIGNYTGTAVSDSNYFGNIKEIFHTGTNKNITDILLNNCNPILSVSGIIDILTPELVSDNDYVQVLTYPTQDSDQTSGQVTFKIKNKKFFNIYARSDGRKILFRICSKADLCIKQPIARMNAGCLHEKQILQNCALSIRLQDIIDYTNDFTIAFDLQTVCSTGYSDTKLYILSSLGSWNNDGSNYLFFGKENGGYNAFASVMNMSSSNNNKDYFLNTSFNSANEWINGMRMRYTITHVKERKEIHVVGYRLNDGVKLMSVRFNYSQDTLTLENTNQGDKKTTLFLGGWGSTDGENCNGIVSNLYVFQKALSEDELGKVLSPMSIGKDYIRAGFEFSELNNI